MRLPWAIAPLLAVTTAALAYIHFTSPPPPADAVRFQILPLENRTLSDYLAVSPEGKKLAFIARDINNRSLLWVRPLDSLVAKRQASQQPQ